MLDLSGRTAFVTGGANGIGRATACVLRAAGAQVVVGDLESEEPDVAIDVTDPGSLERAFAAVPALDIVVANAGTVFFGDLTEHTDEMWQRTVAVNLSGMFYTVRAAARVMKPRRAGAIVLTASTNSYDGEAQLTAYNATKHGVLGILHTAANELGPYGIRVNAVCPGLIRTRLTVPFFSQPDLLREYFRDIPLGRGGEPEEVANAIAFLASDLASFITGAALLVDGGQMAGKFGPWNEATAEFTGERWKLR